MTHSWFLDRFGIDVGSLGLGCAALGNLYRSIPDDEAVAVVDAAWDAGIRCFDTAPLYGHGISERRVGLALATRPRDAYVLSTKVGRRLQPTAHADETIFADVPALAPTFDFSADGVLRSIEESLMRLGTDRIDIVHVHDPDDHLDEAVAAAYPTLIRLREEGVIGAVGLGTNTVAVAEHVVDRVDVDCVLVAGRYTLLDPSADDVFSACKARSIAVVAAGVFNSGVLARPDATSHFDYGPVSDEVLARVHRLAAEAETAGVPLAAAAVQFPARHPAVTLTLIGPQTMAELTTTLAWAQRVIPDPVWADRLRH